MATQIRETEIPPELVQAPSEAAISMIAWIIRDLAIPEARAKLADYRAGRATKEEADKALDNVENAIDAMIELLPKEKRTRV